MDPAIASEPVSRLTYDVAPQDGGVTRLTVTHESRARRRRRRSSTASWPAERGPLRRAVRQRERIRRRIARSR